MLFPRPIRGFRACFVCPKLRLSEENGKGCFPHDFARRQRERAWCGTFSGRFGAPGRKSVARAGVKSRSAGGPLSRGAAGMQGRILTLPVRRCRWIPVHRGGRGFPEGTPAAVVHGRFCALRRQHEGGAAHPWDKHGLSFLSCCWPQALNAGGFRGGALVVLHIFGVWTVFMDFSIDQDSGLRPGVHRFRPPASGMLTPTEDRAGSIPVPLEAAKR